MAIKFSVMMAGTLPLADYAAKAVAIERLGFDEVHIADDLIMRPAWPILTLIAQATTRLRLGPAIVTPRVAHPVYHAANLAALDELSGGRALCGVGRGGFNPLIGVPQPERTLTLLRETIEVMQHVLAGSHGGYAGEMFQVAPEFALQYAPVQRHLPIFIGSWGPRCAELAGRVAAGLKADCTWNPRYLAELRTRIEAGARRAGRDPAQIELTVGPLCSIGPDSAVAARAMRRFLALYLPYLEPMTTAAGITQDEARAAAEAHARGDFDALDHLVSDDALRAFTATGTPAGIIPQIEAIVAAGATHIAFGPPLGPDFDAALATIGRDVLPYFRNTNERLGDPASRARLAATAPHERGLSS